MYGLRAEKCAEDEEGVGWLSFSKKIREAVYAKYNGRCAYCGRRIDIKDMQVDHFSSVESMEGR